MVQTTDCSESPSLSVAQFYDALAPEYDAMTGFQKRFVHERPFFRLLAEKYKIHVALDAGCGTGFHSLLLAQLGVQVTGIDVSEEMIQQARRHATELSLPVRFIEGRSQDLRGMFDSRFDAVFCLGNTLAHSVSDDDLWMTLQNFQGVLRPGGILLLQNLNYDRILERKERVQSVKEVGATTFVRFYDYAEDHITFNVLTITRENGTFRTSLKTIPLRPLRSDTVVDMLRQMDFENIKLYGGITLDTYDSHISKDLVVIARRKDAP